MKVEKPCSNSGEKKSVLVIGDARGTVKWKYYGGDKPRIWRSESERRRGGVPRAKPHREVVLRGNTKSFWDI